MESNALPIPKDIRWKRVLGVALFLGVLYVFRHLAPVLICFVVFERAFTFGADQLHLRAKIRKKGAIGAMLATFLAVVGAGVFFGIKSIIGFVELAKTDGAKWVESITESRLIQEVRSRIGADTHTLTASAKGYAVTVFGYVTETAYVALFLFVGFILAIMYLFEREEIEDWLGGIHPRSIVGLLTRWIGYVADAIAITVRLQVIVACVNAVITLPLLIVLGLPNIPLLFLMVLVSGMIPVVGGVMSGIVLCLVAYDARGFVGVGVFLGVTAVLGKIESYYLSPRLTAQHVKMPGIVLVVSLLMFETVFGFWGLFLSFPALYVGGRILREWKEEEAELARRGGTLSVPPPSVPTS